MLIQFSLFGSVLIIFALIALYIIYNLKDKRDDKVYYYFIILLIFVIIDLFSQAFESIFTPFFIKSIFGQIYLIGYIFIPVTGLFFFYSIINKGKTLNKKIMFLLLFIPIISIIALVTNYWFHSFFINAYGATNGFIEQLAYTYNWAYYLLLIYIYIIRIISLILVVNALFKGDKLYKKTYKFLTIAILITLIADLINLSNIYPYFGFLDLGYALAALISFFALMAYSSNELTPLIKDNIVNNINVGICYFDNENDLMRFNKASSMININKNLLKHNITDIFKNQTELIDFINNHELEVIEVCLNNKWFKIKKQELIKNGENFGYILLFTDITSRVNELNQKTLLSKEVNNRVKNNLQIILSLLNIDLHFYPDNPMIVIEDTRLRLNFMAQLHETIYKSNNLNQINIKEYCPIVAENVKSMENSNINLNYDIDDKMIDIDNAINLGLILMEILKNTINHGYFNNEEGNFYIKFREDKGNFILDLCNDGEPLSEDFDIEKTTTLGMTLVQSLVRGIEGKITNIPSEGVHFRIIFPSYQKSNK